MKEPMHPGKIVTQSRVGCDDLIDHVINPEESYVDKDEKGYTESDYEYLRKRVEINLRISGNENIQNLHRANETFGDEM